MSEKPFHEAANVFPLLQGEQLKALADDIAENGLQEAIWLHEDGSILDGRNRFRACKIAGVEPRFQTYEGSDPLGFVLSLNLHRRHLTSAQKAALAVDVEAYEAEAAKQRQGTRSDIVEAAGITTEAEAVLTIAAEATAEAVVATDETLAVDVQGSPEIDVVEAVGITTETDAALDEPAEALAIDSIVWNPDPGVPYFTQQSVDASVQVSGGDPDYTYVLERKPSSGFAWSPVDSETTALQQASLFADTLEENTDFRVIVTSSDAQSVTSAVATYEIGGGGGQPPPGES